MVTVSKINILSFSDTDITNFSFSSVLKEKSHLYHKYLKNKDFGVKVEKYQADKYVQRRCEPAHIIDIATIMAGIKNISLFDLVNQVHTNSLNMYFPEN